MFKKFWHYFKSHKIVLGLVVIVVLSFGYYGYKTLAGKTAATAYVLAQVTKGNLITSVSGTGQVSVTNQLELKARASGDLLSLNMAVGQEVKTGALLASLNAQDALKSVRDAQNSYDTSKLALDKLKQPASQLTLFQAENALEQAKQAKQKAEDAIVQGYEDAYNSITSAFLDFPTIITNLHDVLYSNAIGLSEINIGKDYINIDSLINALKTYEDKQKFEPVQKKAETDYSIARKDFDAAFTEYKNSNRYSSTSTIEALLNQSVETAKAFSQAAKSQSNYLDSWVDLRTLENLSIYNKIKSYQTDLSNYLSQINSHVSGLVSIQRSLVDNRNTSANAQRTIEEKTISLANLNDGPDALDLRTQELSLQQRANALADAKAKLADYYIRAPFDGVIAKVDVKKGDSISSGTVLATLITRQSTAEVSLNEVDVAKVKVGQKVTLTFDAISDLTLTGLVGEVDALGTVSQGVVTYNIKIVFDSQDERIKPGMSVAAAIITDFKQDVLLVSSAAIKTSGQNSYVLMPDEAISETDAGNTNGLTLQKLPKQQTVQLGHANDTDTEIISGLNEGDWVIIRTVTAPANTASTASQGQSLFGGGAVRGVTGGAPIGR